jgi:hypothetical protein
MSTSPLPAWAQEQIAELEAQIGRRLTPADMSSVDINETGKTMTVARDPLLSEIRVKENVWNRDHGSDPELR